MATTPPRRLASTAAPGWQDAADGGPMDAARFDRFVSHFTGRSTRRGALGFAAAVGLSRIDDAIAKKKGKKGCPKGKIKCRALGLKCCRRSQLVTACQAWQLSEVCPGCSPGASPFCDFCLATVVNDFWPCCSAFAPQPSRVTQCMCGVCACCREAPRGSEEYAGYGASLPEHFADAIRTAAP